MVDGSTTNYVLAYIVPLGLLGSAFYFLVLKKSEKQLGLKEVPYPPSYNWPIFGHLFSLIVSPLKQTLRWHEQTGSIYKLQVGSQLWIMVGDPFLAHDIFVKSGSSTSSRPYNRFATETYSKNHRGIIFGQYGSIWRNNRKTVMSLIKPSSVDEFKELLSFETSDLIRRLSKMSDTNQAFNPYEEIQLCSLNVVLQMSINMRFESTEDAFYQSLSYVVDELMHFCGMAGDISTFVPSLFWVNWLFGLEKAMKKLDIQVKSTYAELIKEGLQSKAYTLVKELYRLKDKEKLITEDDIEVVLRDFIGAGADTISSTIHWALICIAQNSEVQDNIIKELDEWKVKNPMKEFPNFYDDRENLPYLICVQKETIRFRSVVPLGVPHACTKDIVVNGYHIPQGATIIANIAAMHLNSKIYENPEQFKPERFLKKTQKISVLANTSVEERDVFGFGWGRRMCPGIYVAELELFNFFAQFFTKFTVQTELDTKGNPKKGFEFKEKGLKLMPVLNKIRITSRSKIKTGY
ncbi:cytochrome P450 [Sporodiniella umbellata]|nr:cytochrome P450 [Sporodiniella umbellata]